jgi:hypothetical protein
MERIVRISTMIAMAAGFVLCGACGHKNAEPEHRIIEGVAESIDVGTNQVSMRWYNPKKQSEMLVSGTVTDTTEILINGRVARLEDIKVGEKVKVAGRIVKDSGSVQLVATLIEVTREGAGTATAPTTRPASKPARAAK